MKELEIEYVEGYNHGEEEEEDMEDFGGFANGPGKPISFFVIFSY